MTLYQKRRRKGGIVVFSAFLMVALFGMLAFALDLGYVYVARAQIQRSADSAAMAAAWELIDESVRLGIENPSVAENNARAAAAEFASYNPILSGQPGLAQDDVQIGYLADPSDPSEQLNTNSANLPNAVQVRVQQTSGQNGEVRLMFGGLMGVDSTETDGIATAAFVNNFVGFGTPTDGTNQGFLPFALDEETWNSMLAGGGTDDWDWHAEHGHIRSGSDGVMEMNLFPQGTGSPGNRGTVDIGSNNNSTQDIARQILDGVSAADLAFHGGKLALAPNGELLLNGDTGISAGVKDELESIKGQPRIITIFREVNGPGNNAMYTIVKFVCVRVMEVELTGHLTSKRVIIQPATMVIKGGISGGSEITSYYIFSPPWLIR